MVSPCETNMSKANKEGKDQKAHRVFGDENISLRMFFMQWKL